MPWPKDPVDKLLGIVVVVCFGAGITIGAVVVLVAVRSVVGDILRAVL